MKGEGEGVPAKEGILVTVLHKIDEACTWVKGKVKSVFKAFFKFFSKKPEEVLSGNNTQIDNSSEKKPRVQVAPEEGQKVEAVVDDKDASVPAKDSFFVRVWNKIHEAWTWVKDKVKDKVKSASKLFIVESITEAHLGLRPFVTSWGGKHREVLSWINTQLENSSGKPMKVGVVPQEGCLPGEVARLVQNIRKLVVPLLGVGNNDQMKATLNRVLVLVEGLLKLLQKAIKQPWTLIPVLLMGCLLFCGKKAAMALATLINLIVPSTAASSLG